MKNENKEKKRMIKGLSVLFLMIAILLSSMSSISVDEMNFSLETFNIQNIASTENAIKKEVKKETYLLFNEKEEEKKIEWEEVELEKIEEVPEEPKVIWRLPTEQGVVSTYPVPWHAAYDIYSPRGGSEVIYPVADGVVSGIYYDSAGAKIVTILHTIDDIKYTSQYVHLSAFAEGLTIGQEVTTDTPIGWMGATGNASGVHLHLALVDCAMFDPTDSRCYDVGTFLHYASIRVTQGYIGLGNYIEVPASWNSR